MTDKERKYYEDLYPEGTFSYERVRLHFALEDVKSSIKDELRTPFHRLLRKLTIIVRWMTKKLREYNDNANR